MKSECGFVTKIIGVFVLLLFGLGISGYAFAQGYHYRATIQYDAAQADIPEILKAQGKARDAVIYVAEFVDSRPLDDKKEIGKVRERNDDKNPVFIKGANARHSRV
ncbi:MAG TPA: hypothetical protein ENN23_02695 [Deltaproteobacteria bacterium]|nr:hypothetical protein [Deltaproteobacteria bacterium]